MLEKKDEIVNELELIQERKSYVTLQLKLISNIFSHNYRSQATAERNIGQNVSSRRTTEFVGNQNKRARITTRT